ncbi:Leucine rich repeat [Tritrichomonas musculus]|uniref:Leucine rich repeat n=1 Tax=Tritrichomonas musculus TaxID=1915356 RepID=A0ABR2LC12_9EUKA
MCDINKIGLLRKNRKLIASVFKSGTDDSTNQKMLMDSYFFYSHSYYYNLSLNSRREELQQYSGRSDNENDENKSANTDNQSSTLPNSKEPLQKQKKQKIESPLYDFNNVYFTKFAQLIKNFTKLSHITYLSLQNCCLCTIPKQLFSLPKDLVSLDLSNNFITKIPLNMSWKKLKHLNLSGNWLHEWPSIFEHDKFDALEYLNIGNNQIEKTNSNQSSFHNLKTLILSNNLLTEFPLWIKDCSNLKILDISRNSFITNFDLNYLTSIPNLKYLDLSSVKVRKVPLKMQDSLLVLVVSNHMIDSIPIGNFQLIS